MFRVAGRLEKIASAPLSMQGALIDGFKSYVRLTQSPSGQPAMSRIRAEIRGKEYVAHDVGRADARAVSASCWPSVRRSIHPSRSRPSA